MKIQKVPRDINYYEVSIQFLTGKNADALFTTIQTMSKSRAAIRYQQFGDKRVFVQGVKNENNLLMGKLRSIRTDIFPEGINMTTDQIEELDTAKFDGIVETSHFIINFARPKPVLALEYNHHGAKIIDFVVYLERVAKTYGVASQVGYNIITRDSLASLKTRLKRVSGFTFKIHKSYVPELKNANNGIFQTARAAVSHFENDYAIVNINIDFRKFTDTPEVKRSIFGLVSWFEKNPDKRKLFNYVRVTAEDGLKEQKTLEVFDLIVDGLKSKINVEKKPKSRVIVSDDIYPKMLREMNIKGLQ